MKKNTLTMVALAMLGLTSFSLSAQDYAKPTPPPAPTPSANGDTPHDYSKDPYIQKPKTKIISFGFFSPLTNHLSFGYDQIIGTDMILSTQIGIIGVGVNRNSGYSTTSEMGGYAEAGVKLFFSPEFVTDGKLVRYNKMQGGYFKPMLVFSSYNEQNSNVYYNGNQRTTSSVSHTGSAIILCLGRQWILANVVSLDTYAGMGYSLFSDVGSTGNYYSYLESGPNLPLAFTAGLNIGVAF